MTGDPAVTDQVAFWQGEFGDAYINRNRNDEAILAAKDHLWRTVMKATPTPPQSILEIGANIGLNLQVLRQITDANLYAVEPNARARAALLKAKITAKDNVFAGTAAELPLADNSVDFSFTCGVLIHIAPDDLLETCKGIHRITKKYIACVEYFNPTPVDIEYRGHNGYLFKRDFGSFWLDHFTDLHVVDYGFFWKKVTGLDDLTWWIFEKK